MSIKLKTPEQIEGIRKSSRLAAETLKYLEQFVKPGVRTIEIDKKCEEFVRDHGAKPATKGYNGYPASCCTSSAAACRLVIVMRHGYQPASRDDSM